MSSLTVLSEDIIHQKYDVLKRRIKKVSIVAAGVGAIPVPVVDIALNMALLVDEVIYYIYCFGLSKYVSSKFINFDSKQLKCIDILIPGAAMAAFILSRIGFYATVMTIENVLDVIFPIVGSLISGATSAFVTYRFLNSFLDDIRDDAIAIHRHMVEQQSNIRL